MLKRFLILLFIPFWMQAQTLLKPDTYHNPKPTEPLVLDTGSYTFVGLEMHLSPHRGFGGCVWLDARKARMVELKHCRFEGNGSDTAIICGGTVTISHSVFSSFACAIQYQSQSDNRLLVYRNQFEDNAISISLQFIDSLKNPKLPFSLKCNEFINHPTNIANALPRIGIRIGKWVKIGYPEGGIFRFHEFGGEGRNYYDGFSYPNGNLWPTLQSDRSERKVVHGMPANLHDPDSTRAWPNSPKWVSIDNQSGFELTYHRYENEFVGWGSAISGPVLFHASDWGRKMQLVEGKVMDTCSYMALQPKGQDNAMVCEQLLDEQPFLLPTHFQVLPIKKDKNIAMIKGLNVGMDEPVLVSPKESMIRLYIPETVQLSVLQYMEAETGNVLQNNPIGGRGVVEAHLDLRYTDSGTYWCRLMVDGKPVETKKLMVNK